jgi:hypothetical protein
MSSVNIYSPTVHSPTTNTDVVGVCYTKATEGTTIDVSHLVTMSNLPYDLHIDHMYIHGRALSGMWCVGAMEGCRQLIQNGSLSIGCLHGYSFGALVAICFVCDIPISTCIEIYQTLDRLVSDRHQEIVSNVISSLICTLPDDAYIRCCNRVYIGYTKPFPFMTYTEKNTFVSNEELIRYAAYSMTIPGITTPLRECIRSQYIDGAIGNKLWGWNKSLSSTPTYDVELFSPWMYYNHLFQFDDPHIDLLVARGIVDMFHFISTKKDTDCINRYPRTKIDNITSQHGSGT